MKTMMGFSGVPNRYGAVELKAGYQRFLLRALILSSFIHFVLLGTCRIVGKFHPSDVRPNPPTLVKHLEELPLYPFKENSFVVPLQTGGEKARIAEGIPVPVPDFKADAMVEFPTQAQMNPSPGPIGEGAAWEGPADLIIPPEERPKEGFRKVEREPVIIRQIQPVYPEIARTAGIEGTVFANLWITREGRVHEVVIVKTDSELFNQAVIDAARQWIFEPAMMKTGPVPVWLTVPFHFTLK
jgi:TonB family protein